MNNTKHICVLFLTILGCLITAVSVAVNHERSLNLWPGADGNSAAAADYNIFLFVCFTILSCTRAWCLSKRFQSRDLCLKACLCFCCSPLSYERIILFQRATLSTSEQEITIKVELMFLSGFIPPVGPRESTVTRSASYFWSMDRLFC